MRTFFTGSFISKPDFILGLMCLYNLWKEAISLVLKTAKYLKEKKWKIQRCYTCISNLLKRYIEILITDLCIIKYLKWHCFSYKNVIRNFWITSLTTERETTSVLSIPELPPLWPIKVAAHLPVSADQIFSCMSAPPLRTTIPDGKNRQV